MAAGIACLRMALRAVLIAMRRLSARAIACSVSLHAQVVSAHSKVARYWESRRRSQYATQHDNYLILNN
jgi:hypothetical protein